MCRPPPGVSLCQHAADTQRDKFMPIMFNTILLAADFRLADVRLLRHKDKRAAKGHTPTSCGAITVHSLTCTKRPKA